MTQKERLAFSNVAGQQAWHAFRTRVAGVSNLEQARAVAGQAPGRDQPGHVFYANLGDFLRGFEIPARATPPERVLYRDMLRKLGDAGDVDVDRMWTLIERLNHL